MPNLRLHRPESEESVPATLAFPTTELRERLVAGKVRRNPLDDAGPDTPHAAHADAASEDAAPPEPIRFPGDLTVSNDELVRQIERTLDRMQHRLDRFKRDLDDTLRFPTPEERADRWGPSPHGPRPAA